MCEHTAILALCVQILCTECLCQYFLITSIDPSHLPVPDPIDASALLSFGISTSLINHHSMLSAIVNKLSTTERKYGRP